MKKLILTLFLLLPLSLMAGNPTYQEMTNFVFQVAFGTNTYLFGVPSVNGITSPVTIAPGSNTTVTVVSNTITIASTGGGGGGGGTNYTGPISGTNIIPQTLDYYHLFNLPALYNGSTFNVENYGAKHSGHYVVGNMTNGTADIYLTSGSILTNDILVDVKFGGSLSNDFVTTVSHWYSSTHFTISSSPTVATNTITGADIFLASHDDADAVQIAVNSACTNGGGNIVFPGGQYWLSHSINIPNGPNSVNVPSLSFQGTGPVVGMGFFTSPVYSGSSAMLINCEPKGSGTNDGVIVTTNGGFCGYRVVIDNLLFRTPTQPNMWAINVRWAQSAWVDAIIIDSGVNQYDTRMPFPNTNSVALWLPYNGNSGGGQSWVGTCVVVGGFYRGVVYSDSTFMSYLCVCECYFAIAPCGPIDCAIMDLSVAECRYGVDGMYGAFNGFGVSQPLAIFEAREESTTNGWWWGADGASNPSFIYDPANTLAGTVENGFGLYCNGAWGLTNVGGTYVTINNNAGNFVPATNNYSAVNFFNRSSTFGGGLWVSNMTSGFGNNPLGLGVVWDGSVPVVVNNNGALTVAPATGHQKFMVMDDPNAGTYAFYVDNNSVLHAIGGIVTGTNTVPAYEHTSGTNIFWSTVP